MQHALSREAAADWPGLQRDLVACPILQSVLFVVATSRHNNGKNIGDNIAARLSGIVANRMAPGAWFAELIAAVLRAGRPAAPAVAVGVESALVYVFALKAQYGAVLAGMGRAPVVHVGVHTKLLALYRLLSDQVCGLATVWEDD